MFNDDLQRDCLDIVIKLTYAERLRPLDLYSLELRRLHSDLWCYKVLFGHVDINNDEFFEFSLTSQTRGHQYKLYKNTTAFVLGQHFSVSVL